jgi:hypothetical protein
VSQARGRRAPALVGVLLLLLALVVAVLPSGVAAASTLHVTDCADSGANTLRALIGSAAAGETIIYDQNCTTTLASTLTIGTNLTITGTALPSSLMGTSPRRSS